MLHSKNFQHKNVQIRDTYWSACSFALGWGEDVGVGEKKKYNKLLSTLKSSVPLL